MAKIILFNKLKFRKYYDIYCHNCKSHFLYIANSKEEELRYHYDIEIFPMSGWIYKIKCPYCNYKESSGVYEINKINYLTKIIFLHIKDFFTDNIFIERIRET